MATATLTITLFVPGVLVNPLNRRGRLRDTIRRAVTWKAKTRVAWLLAGSPSWSGPAAIQLTAHVARLWDHEEGVAAAVKHVRDEAVRLVLDGDPPRRQDRNGRWYDAPANDGPDSGHIFLPPCQEVRPKNRGVLITIEPRP